MPRHIIVTSVQGRNREQGKNAVVGRLVSGRICISWGGWIGCSPRGRTVEKFKVWFVLQLVLEILIVTTGFLVLAARGATSSLQRKRELIIDINVTGEIGIKYTREKRVMVMLRITKIRYLTW